jgi:hypothetical protein
MTECIIWHKHIEEGQYLPVPECSPGLCILPSVKRVMDAVIRGKEFRSSMPMAMELDPSIWKPQSGAKQPEGKWKYEPGMVPTLPVGTKLSGVPLGSTTDEDGGFIEMMAGASARCLNMPVNLVIGNSSKFNMASSQVDGQPWKTKVSIDRDDFATVPYQIKQMWMNAGRDRAGYFLPATNTMIDKNKMTNTWMYSDVFSHPDPQKNANARAVDLASGCKTLLQIISEQNVNPRRVLAREAAFLGITVQELCHSYLVKRSGDILQVIKGLPTNDTTQTP